MKKKLTRFFTLILCLSLLIGCGTRKTPSSDNDTETTEAASNSVSDVKTIIDGYGDPVEVPAEIKSIVATMWPVPSVVFAVTGRTDVIKTMAVGSMEAYDISMFKVLGPGLENVPTNCLDSSNDITFEELAKVEPNVVLCNQAVYDELGEQIRAIGAVPVRFKFGEFSDVHELIRIIGELFDCEERAQKLIDYQKSILDYLESKTAEQPIESEKPSVLYMTRGGDGEYQVVCPKHLGCKYITLAGGRTVTEELAEEGTTAKVGIEQILAWNPDVILLSNFDDFTPADFTEGEFANEWSKVNAVKNHRVYKTPIGIYRWDTQNIEAPLMVEWLAKVLNPEIYTEFDIEENLTSFYKDFFDYQLTEKDLDMILSKSANIYLNLEDPIYGKK